VKIGTAGGVPLCNTSQNGQIVCSKSYFDRDLAGSDTAQIGEIRPGDKKVLTTVTFRIAEGSKPNLPAMNLTDVNATI
jgi:hypothetical protein